jgi:phage shock protein PspC (stress-responsive transcriptional regulator)
MHSNPSPTSPHRRLTRSATDRKIAGVAGGLGAYLGLDPLLVRIAFAVSAVAGGAGVIGYVALWALVPVAIDAPPGTGASTT